MSAKSYLPLLQDFEPEQAERMGLLLRMKWR
jgi:hypothetical protein